MPISLRFVDEGRGLIQEHSGIETTAETFEALAEILSDEERFKRAVYAISDLSEITDIRSTGNEMKRIAESALKMSSLNPDLVVAIVASKPIAFGMARMWQVYAEPTGWKIEVFQSRQEAGEWLRTQLSGFDFGSSIADREPG